jgi:hypothetical protein
MQTHQDVIESSPAVATDRTQATTYDPYASRRSMSIKLVQAIYLVFGLIEAVLLIRFVLKALGANAEAGFAQFIYGMTGPLVAPFLGLFGTPQAASGATLELHTLIALVIYALVAWLLAKGAWLVFGEGRSASVARTDTERTRVR